MEKCGKWVCLQYEFPFRARVVFHFHVFLGERVVGYEWWDMIIHTIIQYMIRLDKKFSRKNRAKKGGCQRK